jgi:hypothetical protein
MIVENVESRIEDVLFLASLLFLALFLVTVTPVIVQFWL